jgi:16S rRNA (adenine1518-N6/adenine1519-N6)-dimethyltransferase
MRREKDDNWPRKFPKRLNKHQRFSMKNVRPKKSLGQHFLNDNKTAEAISATLTGEGYSSVLEIGPGMGVLTDYLIKRGFEDFKVIEIDHESFAYIKEKYPGMEGIIRGDFLSMDLNRHFSGKMAIVGNFPYNISSQILFRCLEYKEKVVELCGMFQKEVAERICAVPGSRIYGISSVLLQAFYSTEYLFTVEANLFTPPPKVRSGVVRMRRNEVKRLKCNEQLFVRVVKTAFNQRRKTIRNSIKSGFALKNEDCPFFSLRPEQLSVSRFEELTNWIEDNMLGD